MRLLKATDLCVSQPQRAARLMVDRGVAEKYEYVLQSVKEIGYPKWREYDPRTPCASGPCACRRSASSSRVRENCLLEGTDWRFFTELKREMKA